MQISDNPAWSALNTANALLAQGNTRIKRYRPDVSPFVGLEINTPANLTALHQFIGMDSSDLAIVSTKDIEIPDLWAVIQKIPLYQMVWQQENYQVDLSKSVVELSDKDTLKMLELAKITNPGPFRTRTIDFGH